VVLRARLAGSRPHYNIALIQVEDEKLEYAFHSEVRELRHHLLSDLNQDVVNDEAEEQGPSGSPCWTPRADIILCPSHQR
jgi:hypothetical protein